MYFRHFCQNKNQSTCVRSSISCFSVDYNAMYGQQYDNAPRMHESDSVRDSSGHDDVFLYEPKS